MEIYIVVLVASFASKQVFTIIPFMTCSLQTLTTRLCVFFFIIGLVLRLVSVIFNDRERTLCENRSNFD